MRVLLVDDSASDAELIREALEQTGWGARVDVAWDGVEALDAVRRERPDLVLLDLNMPRKNGHEVLRELRTDPATADLPVVILTTSNADADVVAALEEFADAYLTKPDDYDELVRVANSIRAFWNEWGAP